MKFDLFGSESGEQEFGKEDIYTQLEWYFCKNNVFIFIKLASYF